MLKNISNRCLKPGKRKTKFAYLYKLYLIVLM